MLILESLFVYLLGAVGYGGVETLWRGHTHWTMLMLGGVCFLIMYWITVKLPHRRLWQKWLLCTAAVTVLEFAAGCVLNLYLGWDVWDYSGVPGNLLGQVCLPYIGLWFLLSIPCSGLAWAIRRWIFTELENNA